MSLTAYSGPFGKSPAGADGCRHLLGPGAAADSPGARQGPVRVEPARALLHPAYKGLASHFHGAGQDDIERLDLEIDGEAVERPVTQWSRHS
ncbi:MAG TPA: hypothetical protein VKP14_06905 [Gaiellaceae bacterium]|nr:hypothetical protein [Gaiellaceae bacterium]